MATFEETLSMWGEDQNKPSQLINYLKYLDNAFENIERRLTREIEKGLTGKVLGVFMNYRNQLLEEHPKILNTLAIVEEKQRTGQEITDLEFSQFADDLHKWRFITIHSINLY